MYSFSQVVNRLKQDFIVSNNGKMFLLSMCSIATLCFSILALCVIDSKFGKGGSMLTTTVISYKKLHQLKGGDCDVFTLMKAIKSSDLVIKMYAEERLELCKKHNLVTKSS